MKRGVCEIVDFSGELIIGGMTVDNGFYEVEACANGFSTGRRGEYRCGLSAGSPRSAAAVWPSGISCHQ